MENNPTIMLVAALGLKSETGHWLMHRRPPGKPHAGLWEFPGGKLESGETARLALVREIREELGIGLREEDLSPAGFADTFPGEGERRIVILLYTSRHWLGDPRPLEGGDLGWFTPREIAELARPPLDRELCRQLFGDRARASGKEGCQG